MTQKILTVFIIGFLIACGQEKKNPVSEYKETSQWSTEMLNEKAAQHLDSSKWDLALFQQDKDTYEKYSEILKNYPLNKSPFPVAEYDYSVSSIPFLIETDRNIFKGVRIGEYGNLESEKITDKLTLIILTNDKEAEESTLVDSRNFPYLTAQGYFKVSDNDYDWVFSASPDGFSTVIINMKLFDLRFGETILIYPQLDKSFFYEQLKDSPNNYDSFEKFTESIVSNEKVKQQLTSAKNIK